MAHPNAAATLHRPPALVLSDAPFHAIQRGTPGLDRRLEELGVPKRSLQRDLVVPAGAHLELSTERPSALEPQLRVTPSLEQYKQWIGRQDRAEHDLGAAPAPLRTELADDLQSLDADQLADLERAGQIYLFGDSRQVASYRRSLERLRGPFRAALYAARRVVIEVGARLSVSGDPAILLIEELVLQGSGQLVTTTPTHATFAHLEKLDAPSGHLHLH